MTARLSVLRTGRALLREVYHSPQNTAHVKNGGVILPIPVCFQDVGHNQLPTDKYLCLLYVSGIQRIFINVPPRCNFSTYDLHK
jgi:hypothetical protein